jgi:hypothetical protein
MEQSCLKGLANVLPFRDYGNVNWLDYPPLRVVRFSGAAFAVGVEEQVVDGVLSA